ncbi:hypothetical protein [Acinetobacter kanungonis]|uniref:hypothetical protein n=1 Tax=Acinetobacter kanungonis TaxID=2699469 RepID=UPI00137A7CE4|nr:hypothetical protein [Acinetobacter kanungonis]NCI78894.1 hypothetical protein [Acinetobacter kanungonis]
MTDRHTTILRKTMLTSMLSLCYTYSFALEALSDQALSNSTGEGIAILPENFKMVFQTAEDGLTAAQNQSRLANRNYDTGFIRFIPVGPLSETAKTAGAKKADVFLYGLALSASDNNLNSRFSNLGFHWGQETNPWVFSVKSISTTANRVVYDFAGVAQDFSYLSLEAPYVLDGAANTATDNNIKLGLWGDFFARNPLVAAPVDAKNGAPANLNGLDQRLRLQLVENGLSLNGSNLKLFQTLGGAASSSLPTSYNNTLGLAALIRLNTNDNPSTATEDSSKALRISTAEALTTDINNDLTTPAISKTTAPNFNANDGVYLYSPNINLVLGSVYQPLIVDTAADGQNFVIELTRIPNKANVYQQIYTDYTALASGTTSAYKGSTCNIQYCGDAISMGQTYQGNTATHSSISIGTVGFINNNKFLKADTSNNAVGVSFVTPTGTKTNLGSAAIDGVLIQHLKITTTGL